MSQIYSTIYKDGEDLTKVNTWLNKFRQGELIHFVVERVSQDSTRLLIEADDTKRLRILSSWPPNNSYLMTGKSVPYVEFYFTEPVSLESFYDEVKINGTLVDDNRLSLVDDYTLRVDTTGFTMTLDGQYEVVLGTGVRHKNKLWRLYGERKVLWSTSDHGGSRGGEDLEDPLKGALHIAKVSVEGQHSEEKMLNEFYVRYGVDSECVEYLVLVSGYPEYDRTTLWVVYSKCGIPYIKCGNPEYKACFYQDGAPDPVTILIGFTEEIDADSLEDKISVDGTTVPSGDWSLEQGDKLLRISFTPAEYKHHVVKIDSFSSKEYAREWPYAYSFVIHKLEVATDPPFDEDIGFILADTVIYGNTNATPNTVGVHSVFAFNDTLINNWVSLMTFPVEKENSGTLKASIYWSAPNNSGDVEWAVYIGRRPANEDMSTAGFDTGNGSLATVHATANALKITTITITNTDGILPGDFFNIKLSRLAPSGDDTLTGDAHVYGIRLWFDRT